MTTLELYTIILFQNLVLFVFAVRNLRRHTQRWTMMDWMQAIAPGLGLILGIVFVLDLVRDPDRIHPAPVAAWQAWLLRFGVAFTILALLAALVVNVSRRMRQSAS